MSPVISQYVGFFAWNAGLAMGGVARVGQVQLLQTFVTLVFAATLVGETVEPEVWASAVVVVGLVLAASGWRGAEPARGGFMRTFFPPESVI